VERALEQLHFQIKSAAQPILKLLNSGIAAAEHDFHCSKKNLIIKEILVNQGPTLKRWRPRAFGRAAEIRKRTSHIVMILLDPTVLDKKVKGKTEDNKEDVVQVTDIKDIKKDKKVGKYENTGKTIGEKNSEKGGKAKFIRQKSV
jgi:large subunit ribosomal protein L22